MKKMLLFILCASLWVSCKKAETAETESPADATAQPAEFADTKYTEIGKKYIADLAKGDIDGMMAVCADNANYYWNAGDSLVGKPAIAKFWTDRRMNVVETISFKNDIWLPLQVNQSQQTEKAGVWLLSWYQVTAKYKGGSSMTQWMHMLYHFDDADKIDEVHQYVDMAPINAALPKK
jgi:ketosteroid isomerase-like protein